MFVSNRSPRKRVLLVGAGAVAIGALLWSNGLLGGGELSAQIPGAPLDQRVQLATEAATFANLADPPAAPRGIAPPAIDLDRATLEGERYVVPLADGRKAVLTLQPELQKLAERLLNESRAPRGGIVVLAPDGRVLALAGRRTEEPKGNRKGTFDWRLATEVWAPAASVFKLVTAAALVKAGVDPDGRVCYHGGVRSVLEHNLQDDKRDNRCEDLAYGVAHSNNAILGKLAFQKLEPATLEAEARAFGWGSPLPAALSLPGTTGELAIPATRDLAFARTAAGFSNDKGGTGLSVMGGALVAATFAGDGLQVTPRLVESVDGVEVAVPAARRVLAPETARAVAKMMVRTCKGGSAVKSFGDSKHEVAGKTGTLTKTEPFYMEHSWFVGFAPAGRPSVIVSVLFGNPESWHLRGHEAARRLIDRAIEPARPREKGRNPKRTTERSRS